MASMEQAAIIRMSHGEDGLHGKSFPLVILLIQSLLQSLYKKIMTRRRYDIRSPKFTRDKPIANLLLSEADSLARLERRSELAGIRSTSRGRLGLVARSGTLELLADLLNTGRAGGAVDGSGVAKVGVDADEELAGGGLDILDHDVTLGALLAVSAGAVELTEVGDLEAVDGDGSGAVVLDHLVLGSGGTAAGDGGITILLQGEGVCTIVSGWKSKETVCYLPSQTAAHQTFSRVQEPWQWIPSIWSAPMMLSLC